MRSLPFLCLLALSASAADNSLTSAEKQAGWKLLFDGKSMKNWRDPATRNPAGDAWEISNGTLKTRLKPRLEEDLVSAESYGDFELLFDWKVSEGGNTGVKYRLQRFIFYDDTATKSGPGGFEAMLGREIANAKSERAKLAPGAKGYEYTVGFEFQLIDDKRHADALKDKAHTTGALYSMIPPIASPAHPAGEWNQGRLVVKGNHVEHWINGVKTIDASLDDPAVGAGVSKRWGQVPAVMNALVHPKPYGPISLQHHGDEVWFKNLKIRSISPPKPNPFLGKWNFNITTPNGNRASWLGITENEIWYQPPGGNVFEVKNFYTDGNKLTLILRPNLTWELERSGDKLTGTQTGIRAPELKRPAPKSWSKPEPLFNGKNLDGWEAMGKPETNHWMVKDGYLVNETKGANLKTSKVFDDFKLHFEVNCPDHANSGFYLRGRYEVQLEYEPLSANPPERRIGSIYGRIAPKVELPRKPGEWDTFDVTLVGRNLTVVRNGTTIIDHQEIEGITGGALDANEGEPGPFYIQGDHTGGLKFRNITVATAKR